MRTFSYIALALISSLSLLTAHAANKNVKHVAITQIVEHPALNSCRKGIKDELAESGFVEGKTLKWSFENAQGSPATAAQIAKKFSGAAPDVVVGIATPSAQALASSARNIPMVFSAVTDPVGAKLVASMDKPNEGNTTGVSDLSPIDSHMALVKTIVPHAKRLGVIFNPGEANSATLVDLVKQFAPQHGLTVVKAGAPKSSDVLAAARSLVGKVDVIYIPTDNTVISAFEAVIKVATQAKIPLISADTDSVKRGAIAAQGFNYYDLGRQTGKMVVRILRGERAGDIQPEGVSKTDLYLNPEAAKRMGITLSADLLASAKAIVKTMTRAEREAEKKK